MPVKTPIDVGGTPSSTTPLDGGAGDDTYNVMADLAGNVTINDNDGANKIVFKEGFTAKNVEYISFFGSNIGIKVILKDDDTDDTNDVVISIQGLANYTYEVSDRTYTSSEFVTEFLNKGFEVAGEKSLPEFGTIPSGLNIDEVARGSDTVTKQVGRIAAMDADGDTLEYEIESARDQLGNAVTGFSIDAEGNVTYTGGDSLDGDTITEVVLSIRVSDGTTETDGTKVWTAANVTVRINDINDELPVFLSSTKGTALVENTAITGGADGDVIYTANARPDLIAVEWEMKDKDTSPFMIDVTTGQVRFKETITPDADGTNSSYTFTVVAKSRDVRSEQTVTIDVTDLNDELPTIGPGTAGVALVENTAITGGASGDVVYTADGEHDMTPITWSLKDAEKSLFMIDATSGAVMFKKTTTPDADIEGTRDTFAYTFTVVATSGTLTPQEKEITLTVVDLNDEDPTITFTGPVPSIDENTAKAGYQLVNGQATGDIVYTAAGYADLDTDVDTSSIIWSLVVGVDDADDFVIDASSGKVWFAADTTPDHEAKTSYNFTVKATAGGRESTQAVRIEVNDLNDEVPVFNNTETEKTVAENSTDAFFTASATSDVAGDEPTYSVTSGDVDGGGVYTAGGTNYVTIDPSSGAVRLTTEADFETKPVFSFQVTATEGALQSTHVVTVNLTDVDDAPPEFTRKTLLISPGETGTFVLSEENIAATDDDTENLNPVYEISSLPAGITVRKDGVALAEGRTFTGSDLQNGAVTLTVTDSGALTNFSLTVSDGPDASDNTSDPEPFVFEFRETADVVAKDTRTTEIGQGNTASFSDVTDKNLYIDAGAGDDDITGSDGSDEIIGGRGLDTIRLDGNTAADNTGDSDIVTYHVGAGYSAADGGDGNADDDDEVDLVEDFNREEDVLKLKVLSSDTSLEDVGTYLSGGKRPVGSSGEDYLVLKAVVGLDSGSPVITGITLEFNGSGMHGDRSGTLRIEFDQAMTYSQFVRVLSVTDSSGATTTASVNGSTGQISDPAVLENILGGKGRLVVEVDELATAITVGNTTDPIDENTVIHSSNSKVGDINITDADGGSSGTLELVGDDAALFEIDGRVLRLVEGAELDHETNPTLNVRVQLAENTSVFTNVAIQVTNVNETPSVPVQGASPTPDVTVDESVVHTFRDTDFRYFDPDGDTLHSVTITSLPSQGTLVIVNAIANTETELTSANLSTYGTVLAANIGNLVYRPASTERADHTVEIGYRVSDGELISAEGTLSIRVTADDDVATVIDIENATASIYENADTTSATKVGDITFTDPDGGSSGTPQLAQTGDYDMFEISGSELRLKAGASLDYETKNTLSVRVQLSEDNTVFTNVAIQVTNVNDTPPEITSDSTGTALPEGTEVLTTDAVYTADGTYDLTPIIWSLKQNNSDDAGLFDIDRITGRVTFKTDKTADERTPDYETKNSYAFTIVARSGTLAPVEQDVTVAVTNFDFVAGDITIGTVAHPNIVQADVIGATVGTASVPRHPGKTITYDLAEADKTHYQINNNGVITLIQALPDTIETTDSITVIARIEAENLVETATKTFAVNRLVVDDPRDHETFEGKSLAINLEPPRDPEGDVLSFVSVNISVRTANGSYMFTNGDLVWTPVTGFTGTETFSVNVQDSRGGVTSVGYEVLVNPTIGLTGGITDGVYHAFEDNPMRDPEGQVAIADPSVTGYTLTSVTKAVGVTAAPVVSNNSKTVTLEYGELTYNSEGRWSYDLNNSDARVNALDGDDDDTDGGLATLTEQITFTFTKGAETLSETVDITIHGATEFSLSGNRKYNEDLSIIGNEVNSFNTQIYEGKSGDDIFYGSSNSESIRGRHGNDWLFGNGGGDTFFIFAGQGNDVVDGGLQTDALWFNYNYNSINSIKFDLYDDTKWKFDSFKQEWSSADSDDQDYGEYNFVRVWVDRNNDGIGNADDDGDGIIDSDANDEYHYLKNIEYLRFYGSRQADVISGGDSSDTIYGHAGNDILDGREGHDTYGEWHQSQYNKLYSVHLNLGDNARWKMNADSTWSSGKGDDYTYIRVWFDLNDDGVEDASDEFDYITNFERVYIHGGGGFNNHIIGGDGTDWIYSYLFQSNNIKGNTSIYDGAEGGGHFFIYHKDTNNPGNVSFDAESATKWKQNEEGSWVSGITEDYTYSRLWHDVNLNDTGDVTDNYNYFRNFERFIYRDQSGSNDNIAGSGDYDYFDGGDGNDILIGRGGGDYLSGGDGDDTLDGGSASKALKGGKGNDIFVLYQGPVGTRNKIFDGVSDYSSGTASGEETFNGTVYGGNDKIRVDLDSADVVRIQNLITADRKDDALDVLKSTANLRWTQDSDIGGGGTWQGNDTSKKDTVIYFTEDPSNEIVIMVLRDFTEDLTIDNFEII
ncbi:MAG: cadherin-like domain-containing protein [Parvularculales bacterium]